jgi:hypothetical protein
MALAWVIVAVGVGTFSGYTLMATAAAGVILVLHPAGDRRVRIVAVAVQAVVQGEYLWILQSRSDLAAVEEVLETAYDGHMSFSWNRSSLRGRYSNTCAAWPRCSRHSGCGGLAGPPGASFDRRVGGRGSEGSATVRNPCRQLPVAVGRSGSRRQLPRTVPLRTPQTCIPSLRGDATRSGWCRRRRSDWRPSPTGPTGWLLEGVPGAGCRRRRGGCCHRDHGGRLRAGARSAVSRVGVGGSLRQYVDPSNEVGHRVRPPASSRSPSPPPRRWACGRRPIIKLASHPSTSIGGSTTSEGGLRCPGLGLISGRGPMTPSACSW